MYWGSVFGYLWEKGFLKDDKIGFSIWIWLVNQWWYQWLSIPYHCILGVHYGYEWNSILQFCRYIVKE